MSRNDETTHRPTPIAGVELDGSGLEFLIDRDRLIERLCGTETPVIVLQAPAGYGKSVLLAQWARRDPRSFVSLTVTDAHNDPAALLAAVIAALERVEPLPDDFLEQTEGRESDLDLVVPLFEAAVRNRSADTVLVLDEVEHLTSEPSLRLLQTLLGAISGGSRAAMATRGDAPPHAARMQGAGRLTTLGPSDLLMTSGEARRALAAAGIAATEEEVETIVERTEGWPVALYLASRSRLSQTESSLPDEGFGGQERNLVDYMRDEFLASAPAEDVEFLVRISFLDRVQGSLCNAVLGSADAGSRLAALSRRNMLLIPLDRRDEWFRMHSLFSDMLRGELERRFADEIPELNGRASEWWEREGDFGRAIGFAIGSGDFARVGKLVWEAVPSHNTTGRYATIQGWIEQVGTKRVAEDPHLSVTVAHTHLAAGDGGGAEYWAGVAGRHFDSVPEVAADLRAGLEMINATLARGGLADMRAAADRAGDSLPRGETTWSSMVSLMKGIPAHLSGDAEGARRFLSEAARGAAVAGAPLIQALALSQMALLAAGEDDFQGARILASQGRAQVDRFGIVDRPSIALVVAVSAYVNAAQRRAEDARADLGIGRELFGRLDDFGGWFEAETALSLAAAGLELNEPDTAAPLLAGARTRLAAEPDAPVLISWADELDETLVRRTESGASDLSPAELRVLRYLPSHLSYPQIAADLYISTNTVKSHVKSAFRKLGVASRNDAVEICREMNLVPPEAGREEVPAADR